MEPLASVTAMTDRRPAGWQMQIRVDYVVNRVMMTHRGQSEDQIAQALHDQLRRIGMVPSGRQVQQYASAIAHMPPLPPRTD